MNAEDLDSPTDLPSSSLRDVVKRARAEFRRDHLTDLAAGLTYYATLSAVPALIVLVAALGLLGPDTTPELTEPGPVDRAREQRRARVDPHRPGAGNRTGAGIGAIVGILVALWSASGYVAAFMRASNVIYDIGEGRPIWKTAADPDWADRVGRRRHRDQRDHRGGQWPGRPAGRRRSSVPATRPCWSGTSSSGPSSWCSCRAPRRPVLGQPQRQTAGIKWVSPGGVIAVLIWLGASALFALYVSLFASYDKTYGSMAGVVIFLVWLWITNIALLLGAEVNAELEHGKAIAEGLPPDLQPFAEPRDTRKLDEEETAAVEAAAERRSDGGD